MTNLRFSLFFRHFNIQTKCAQLVAYTVLNSNLEKTSRKNAKLNININSCQNFEKIEKMASSYIKKHIHRNSSKVSHYFFVIYLAQCSLKIHENTV